MNCQGGSVWRDGAVVQPAGSDTVEGSRFHRFSPHTNLFGLLALRIPIITLAGDIATRTVFPTTKGCPYRCGYCPYPYGLRPAPDLSVLRANVGADIERLKTEFGVEQILFPRSGFHHQSQTCKGRLRRIDPARTLASSGSVKTRYDLVDEEIIDLMWRAGCREIHYGPRVR